MDFAVLVDHKVKTKESEKRDKFIDLTWELKKLWNMKVTVIPIVIGALGTISKVLIKGLEDKNQRMNRSHSDYSIIKIGQNPEESAGGLRRLAVTQTRVKDHQLILMWKTLQE